MAGHAAPQKGPGVTSVRSAGTAGISRLSVLPKVDFNVFATIYTFYSTPFTLSIDLGGRDD